MTLLEIEDLMFHYLTQRGIVLAVDDVDFKLERGESIGIVGESGCGKFSTANA